MNKEEVLKMAKNENRDEMELQVRDRAMRWTYLAMVIAAAIFAEIRSVNNQPMMDLCVTVCVSVTVGQFYCFVKTKEKSSLIFGIITLAAGVFALIRFCMGH